MGQLFGKNKKKSSGKSTENSDDKNECGDKIKSEITVENANALHVEGK